MLSFYILSSVWVLIALLSGLRAFKIRGVKIRSTATKALY
jgi:hypothetical protein